MRLKYTDADLGRLISQVAVRKEAAKDYRDGGDIEAAIEALREAVTLLESSPLTAELLDLPAGDASPSSRQLATQLADCLGMLGGNYRRLGRLDEAQQCFRRGRAYEESLALEVKSSYNLVNAITLPLEHETQRRLLDYAQELQAAVNVIRRQVRGERRNDRWAWADLGQCQLLLNEVEESMQSYRRARDLGNDETVTSIVGVLERLQAALQASDPKASERIKEAIRALETY